MTYQGYTKYSWRGRHAGQAFLVPLLGLLVAGCGSQGNISGKVLYQGKPLRGGTVTFFTPHKGAMSCIITSDGNYSVSRVPVGEVKIAVQCLSLRPRAAGPMRQMVQQAVKSGKVSQENVPAEVKQRLELSAPPASEKPVGIPPDYNDPEKSGLTYTVTGGEQTHDIELK